MMTDVQLELAAIEYVVRWTPMKGNEPTIFLTESELKGLPEYSWSLPTGVYIGKRWKALPGHPPDSGRNIWVVGEYHALDDPDKAGVRWFYTTVVNSHQPVDNPHPKEAKLCQCHMPDNKFGVCSLCVAWRVKHAR